MQPETNIPPPTSTRKWFAVGLAALIVWAIFASAAKQILNPGGLPAPSLETSDLMRPAEFRWKLEDLEGKPVDFASFQGRPILLNLWATWCPPCLQEMPSIANLAASKDLEGRNVAIVCVSTDESAPALHSFMKGKDWKMTILRANSIPPAYQSEGIPATYLIDKEGRIAAAELGAARWDDPSVIAFLQRMAASKGK